MAIVLDGSSAAGTVNLGTNGTISNLAVGGLPDGIVDADMIATEAVTKAKQGPGSIVQYVVVPNTDLDFRTDINSNSYVTTGHAVTITPTNATNKIVIAGNVMLTTASSTNIYLAINDGSSTTTDDYAPKLSNPTSWAWKNMSYWFTLTAGSTSAKTYTLYARTHASAVELDIGWDGSPSTGTNQACWMHAMEVVA
jgi:hypothetical protein|tara:strand:+ start:15 stop:602 length:588 start_codon:yes stop_codon:yes gene_type:complete